MDYQKTLVGSTPPPLPKPSLRTRQEWGLHSQIKKIETNKDLLIPPSQTQPDHYWQNRQTQRLQAKVLRSNIYYPPNSSGYDIAFCPYEQAIYIYGGIPCSQSLQEGIKAHFYKFQEGKWSEVHPESTYNPTPRYGHTLTAGARELILLGGVSEYK